MDTTQHYNFNDWAYATRGDGSRSKRYKHWCSICFKDRGYGYKNKILKEPMCHSCKMVQPSVLNKISESSKKLKHTKDSRVKISKSMYTRYGSNPTNRRIAVNLRGRLNQAIKKSYKGGSAVRDLGCSIEEFKVYLECRFQPGMSWDNYGAGGWHIDHIVPLCRFDLSSSMELKKACNYTNLQPLWANDNLEKRKTDGTFRNK